jgi:hypothetical protein
MGSVGSSPKAAFISKKKMFFAIHCADRVTLMHLIKSISIFPYGGKICSKHRNELYNNDIQANTVVDQISGVHSWEIGTYDRNIANEVLVMLAQSPIKSESSKTNSTTRLSTL